MENCVFCKIIDGKIPAPRVYENEHVFVIRDLHPQAKTHLLVIPKTHVVSLAEAFDEEAVGREWVGRLFSAANEVARKEGLLPSGYRSVINTGSGGGQSVFHLHLHILAGEKLAERFA
jgi:histidine triad (HIT) family protein